MVSGWAIKACLSSWPFSLGLGEETQQEVVRVARVGDAELLGGPLPNPSVRERIQGRHLLA